MPSTLTRRAAIGGAIAATVAAAPSTRAADCMPSPVATTPDGQSKPQLIKTWDEVVERYRRLKAEEDKGDIWGCKDDEIADFVMQFDDAQTALLLHPAPNAAAISEKFVVLLEAFGDDFEIFTDRRELQFLAAIEADAVRLIGG